MLRQELIHGERRTDRRYDLRLGLRFSYDEHGQIRSGKGYTIDMSSGGIRFFPEFPLPSGSEVELRIEWPFLLQNICPLELVVNGTVLRSGPQETVLRTRRLAFHTCGERSFEESAPALWTYSITA